MCTYLGACMCYAGALAVVIAHDVALADDESQRGPRTWCFCPDSLCMDSKPKGSNLPAWWVPLEGMCMLSQY